MPSRRVGTGAARLCAVTNRSVRGLRAAALLAASLGLSGCAVFSPVQTTIDYNPADGVPVGLGTVKIENLLVVAPAKDGPGTVSASVVNNGDKPVAIAFRDDTSQSTAKFEVPAFSTVQMSGDGNLVELDHVSAAPGATIAMTVLSAISGQTSVQVPVLDAQQYYRTLQPTAVPTDTATATATPTASATAAG